MSISLVQQVPNYNISTTALITPFISSGGTTLICQVSAAYALRGVTDSAGNTWVLVKNSGTLSVYAAYNASAVSSITVTSLSSTANYQFVSLTEWTGIAGSAALDATATASGYSATPTTGSVTVAQSGELVLAGAYYTGYVSDGTLASSGYTDLTHVVYDSYGYYYALLPAYQIASASGAHSVSWSCASSVSYYGIVAAFKASSGDGSFSGSVTERGSGSALSGVTVSLDDPASDSTTTDGSGAYSLSGIPIGTYTATYSKPGYFTKTISISIAGDTTTTQNVVLVPLLVYQTFNASVGAVSIKSTGMAKAVTVPSAASTGIVKQGRPQFSASGLASSRSKNQGNKNAVPLLQTPSTLTKASDKHTQNPLAARQALHKNGFNQRAVSLKLTSALSTHLSLRRVFTTILKGTTTGTKDAVKVVAPSIQPVNRFSKQLRKYLSAVVVVSSLATAVLQRLLAFQTSLASRGHQAKQAGKQAQATFVPRLHWKRRFDKVLSAPSVHHTALHKHAEKQQTARGILSSTFNIIRQRLLVFVLHLASASGMTKLAHKKGETTSSAAVTYQKQQRQSYTVTGHLAATTLRLQRKSPRALLIPSAMTKKAGDKRLDISLDFQATLRKYVAKQATALGSNVVSFLHSRTIPLLFSATLAATWQFTREAKKRILTTATHSAYWAKGTHKQLTAKPRVIGVFAHLHHGLLSLRANASLQGRIQKQPHVVVRAYTQTRNTTMRLLKQYVVRVEAHLASAVQFSTTYTNMIVLHAFIGTSSRLQKSLAKKLTTRVRGAVSWFTKHFPFWGVTGAIWVDTPVTGTIQTDEPVTGAIQADALVTGVIQQDEPVAGGIWVTTPVTGTIQ